MPIPSWLNNLTTKSNLSPSTINSGLTDSTDTPPTQSVGASNLGGGLDIGALTKVLNFSQPQTPIVPVQPAPIAQVTPTVVTPQEGQNYQQQAIQSGNMNNPLNQYSNEFGQNYANQNMGGYNPVAELHKLQNEQAMSSLQGTGLYSLPKDELGNPMALSPDQVAGIRKSANDYYSNQIGMTRGEATDMMSGLKGTVTGGILGTLPPKTYDAVDKIRTEYIDDPSTRAMFALQNTLNQADGIYKKNIANPGYANGTDDYRLMFLLSNAMNPNSQVSEGDFKNAQSVTATIPGQWMSNISRYVKTDAKGNLDLADVTKGFLTPEGRKAVYSAIQDHYKETTINNDFMRKQKATLIDAYAGRQGLGEAITQSVLNPANIEPKTQATQNKTTNASPYAEQW